MPQTIPSSDDFQVRAKRAQEKVNAILTEEGLAMMPTITFMDTRKDDTIIKPAFPGEIVVNPKGLSLKK